MSSLDLTKEIVFQTTRSGGKGGQNVNKVETAVEGYFHVSNSLILSEEQKGLLHKKLATKINSEGFLQVRSQVHRSQLENKQDVIKKMHILVEQAIKKEKKRIATKPSKAAKAKRLDAKKVHSDRKQNRQKIRRIDH